VQIDLEQALRPLGPVKARRLFGRLLVELPDDKPFEEASARIRRVFGVAFFGRAILCEPSIAAIEQAVGRALEGRSFETFSVRARRADKSHPFGSRELEAHIGSMIDSAGPARVDLTSPDLRVEIHVLSREAIVFCERIPGPGGIPVGSSGNVVALISGGIDSPVAASLAMKRGCRVAFVHFHSSPFTSSASQDKVRDLVADLARFGGPTTLYLVPFAELQQVLVRDAPADPRIVLYRRFMVRIAERIARCERALALVTGESLGQVSSQTLANLDTINRVATLPVLRPLIAMDKAEIIELARRIGTYETSIEPDEDCCSYLMPRRPETWTRPEHIEQIERRLDVEGMIEQTLARVAREKIEMPS
jgi:thiamine biosynthesis protein ThiI